MSRSTNFQIIEMDQNIATAVNKEPFSFKRLFLRCLPFQIPNKGDQPNDSLISAIRL